MWLEATIRISGKVGAWVECETVRKGGEEQGMLCGLFMETLGDQLAEEV